MPRRGRPPARRPSREELARYLRESPRKVGKREIARAFGLGKSDNEWLAATLRELAADGAIQRSRGRRADSAPSARRADSAPSARRARSMAAVPPVAVVQVLGVDADGEVYGGLAEWKGGGAAPRVHLVPSHGVPAPAVGDRVLARTRVNDDGSVSAKAMRLLESRPAEVLGVYALAGGEGRILPTNKRQRSEFRVHGADAGGAQPGDVVLAEVVGVAPGARYPRDDRLGLGRARVRQRIGGLDDPRTLSLIAIHEHGIPNRFSADALREADAGAVPELGTRTDFRDVPFVTIDPVDARDFDDAVWAAPAGTGWEVKVAVADVAAYVKPGSALDREAAERGNSVYFPDRVVPMIPHALSGGVCSLQAGEERACLVATLWLDADGNVQRHKFDRGLMRSAMRLTYERAQAIHDHGGDPAAEKLLAPLWGAFAAFEAARTRRKPLEIVSPELVVRLGSDGHVADVHPRPHLASMRLIEEYMIAANVAAAQELEASRGTRAFGPAGLPTMYRVHDEPDPERVEALRNFLDSLSYKLARGQRLRPQHFNAVLARVKGTPHEAVVNQIVLRTQAQAVYSPEAAPHFGLALHRYVHFTSPIRRYADLLVHRALIAAKGFGNDGLIDFDPERFAGTAEHISMTERRAMMAERDATDRYLAAFLSSRVGGLFAARISGVTSAGLFVTLTDTGAQALIPMRSLHDDRYLLDEAHHRLIGQRTSHVLQLGDIVEVRLIEATAASGGLLAELVSGGMVDTSAGRKGRRGRPQNVRRGRRRR